MAQIRIRRDHPFGLAKARKIAWQWAEDVERDFDMACTVVEGEVEDVVEFTRTGVSGTLKVTGSVFELDAKLGLLLGAFASTIESKIEQNLDELMAGADKGKGAKDEAKKGKAPPSKAADAAGKAAKKKTGKG
jgi:putative polyhydroxyalkanoate system protein